MNIIGLGSAGCNLAEYFEKDEKHNVKLFDVDIEGDNCYSLPTYNKPEEYEKNFPDIQKFLGNLHKETIFFVCGSGKVSGASLKLLEQLKNTKITCVYLRSDVELLGNVNRLQDRLVFNVLQEYSRSGIFSRTYLVDNLSLENILGDIPVIGYYQALNDLIYNTFNSILNFSTVEPIINNYSPPKDVSRISTIGIYNIENNIEKLFYPLDMVDDKCYNFVINEDSLKSDGKLFKDIKNRMKEKVENNTKISYRIFNSASQKNYCYLTANSKIIQK